jgi:type IV secretion system protein VirB10
MQFQQAVSSMPVETVDATHIQHLDYTITQGTLIPGSLQTAIDSDLPGMVKATVSMDVYAASGNRVLIPKGATLIGQYSSGIAMAQRRVLVVWTRLICPDGVDVMLGSPGTNSLGQAGLGADRLDTHFWTRFGQASLLSIIGAGIATAGVQSQDPYNSAAAYRSAIANNFQQTSNTALNATLAIKPTIHIDQGARITVFVNRDLSFYNALSTAH